MRIKHFDIGSEVAVEAHHLGIFGKTGSGKSVLAKMILTAYARYPKMALLVIDPQGEFAKDIRGGTSVQFALPMKQMLDRLGKERVVFSVRDLILDRWELFAQILYESPFFEQLSIPKTENRVLAAQALTDRLQREGMQLKSLHERATFEQAWRFLGEERTQKVFYRTDASRQRFQSMYEDADSNRFYSYWRQVAELFRERPKARRVEQILNYLFDLERDRRALVVIDLSADQMARAARAGLSDLPLFGGDDRNDEAESAVLWNDTIQALVIQRLLDGIRFAAERSFKQNRSLNTLVLIDEAHRLAPREDPENEELRAVRKIFIDAVRTTRKYGLGWMFISQTLSSLHREIVEQLRIFFFGFGLGMGMEFRALSELVGGRGKAIELYQLFRDPHSSFDVALREYSFMTIGPVSPLSFAGTPLFFNVFNTPDEFLDANSLLRSRVGLTPDETIIGREAPAVR